MFHLKKWDSESGIVLIVVMMATLVSSLLATSYMSIVMHESKNAVWQRQRVQSLFLAEAGVQKGLYFLNNPEDPDNPWVQSTSIEPQIIPVANTIYYDDVTTPGRLESTESYGISLHKSYNNPDGGITVLPEGFYLIRSVGLIPRKYSKNIEHRISCIVAKLDRIDVHGALTIMDKADPEPEMEKFESAAWKIDGRDHNLAGKLLDPTLDPNGNPTWPGVPSILVANEGKDDLGNYVEPNGDDVAGQLGDESAWGVPGEGPLPDDTARITGVIDGNGDGVDETVYGSKAIIEDPKAYIDLYEVYVEYFLSAAINISGCGDIPEDILGTPTKNQILYADLSKGRVKVAGGYSGNGVLILYAPPDGASYEFEMAGNSEWNGLIICAGDGVVRLKGGGNTPAHINGALMISDGFIEMNGTADITYSTEALDNAFDQCLLYQVYSWCGGWGNAL
jgi:hypothetical protein